MPKLHLSCPSKTFLIGEYLAMTGQQPALVVNTVPRFNMHIQTGTAQQINHIENNSPASRFIAANPATFHDCSVTFTDPHKGKGGLGASSAQFLLVIAYHYFKQNPDEFDIKNIDKSTLLADYFDYAWDGCGFRPSGADIIGQYTGFVSCYEQEKNQMTSLRWPFNDINFCLLRTGIKVTTHEHLKALAHFPLENLEKSLRLCQQAFQLQDALLLTQAINHYADELIHLGFIVDSTQQLIKRLKIDVGILAAKGCGALGADIILVIHKPDKAQALTHWAQQQGLSIVATQADLSHGLQIVMKD